MESFNNYMVKLRTTCNERIYKSQIKIGERNEFEYKSKEA